MNLPLLPLTRCTFSRAPALESLTWLDGAQIRVVVAHYRGLLPVAAEDRDLTPVNRGVPYVLLVARLRNPVTRRTPHFAYVAGNVVLASLLAREGHEAIRAAVVLLGRRAKDGRT